MAILFVVSLAMVIIGQREVGYVNLGIPTGSWTDWHFVCYTSV